MSTAALIERRWRPPDKDEAGQHPRKVPPAPKAKLPLNSNAIIPGIGAFASAAVDLRQSGLFPIPLGGADGKAFATAAIPARQCGLPI
jgi:hypothetical protein